MGGDVDAGEPAAETGMGMVPADDMMCAYLVDPLGVGLVLEEVPAMRVYVSVSAVTRVYDDYTGR